MAAPYVNVLLTSFPGLGLPSTLCTTLPSSSTASQYWGFLSKRLPSGLNSRLILTTASNKELCPSSNATIQSLLSDQGGAGILSLRLSVPICGGKGGFGSQLRAAGGRMSSKKKRAQGENNGSYRNLDGRRLRTVAEAKALAEYLEVKPEMDKKEKEERRKRWEQVVQAAQLREEEIQNGKANARVDGKWAEEKEEAETKMREAILAAMENGTLQDTIMEDEGEDGEGESGSASASEGDDKGNAGEGPSTKDTTPTSASQSPPSKARKVYGWDDDDELDSDDESEGEE